MNQVANAPRKVGKVYPWVVVALLSVVALLNYLDRQMLSTMKEAMSIDIVELQKAEAFGALMSIFLWIYGIMSPIAGSLADKFSRKWLIVFSLFVWSAVTYGMGLTTNFTTLMILRGVMGVSEAFYIPAALSLIADYHTGGSRSLAVGIHMTGLYVGQALGGFGATVAAAYTWHTTFHWFGIIGMAYAIVLIFCLRDIRIAPAAPAAEMKEVSADAPKQSVAAAIIKNPAFWVILIYFLASSFPGWAVKNWLPTLFGTNLGWDMAKAGPFATITIAAASFVGVVVGGVLSDKWVKKALRGRIFTSTIGLTLTIPALYLLGFGHSVGALLAAGILFGVGYGMFDTNNMPILCQFVSVRYRATAYGVMNMAGVFGGALITQLLGALMDKDTGNLGLGFAMLSVVVAAVVVLALIALRPKTDNAL